MKKKIQWVCLLLAALLLTGCMPTVDEMYYPPKRSEDYNDLQSAIDGAMSGLEYCAPLSGENQQAVQNADLDGDGTQEYLVFAKGNTEHPLRILVFRENDETFEHVQTIENTGAAFEQVEYASMDEEGGVEIVVGSQVADQIARSVTVYHFDSDMKVTALVTTTCIKFLTADLDADDLMEVFVLRPGQTDTDYGIAEFYGIEEGILERSNEVNMSESADKLKRILVGKLHGGESAVYVASTVDDTTLITDVYACQNGKLANISLSSETDTSVRTMRNYYVYADDIDNDGVVELPALITMHPLANSRATERHDLIRWYAMRSDGQEINKMYTYHNFVAGWYVELDSRWAVRLTVVQQTDEYIFHLWDPTFTETQAVLTITAQRGEDREQQLMEDAFILHSSESVTYWASLTQNAYNYGITQDVMIDRFHLVQRDWKTGET